MHSSGRCFCSASACIGVFVSLIVGAIIGVLSAFGIISVGTYTLWIVLVLAFTLLFLVLLALLLAAITADSPLGSCLRGCAAILLASILGTIIVALVLSFVSASSLIAFSIVIAIEAFFFTLMLIALIAFISCILWTIRA